VKWSASIYPASLWSIAPGHHGNPRATGLLRAIPERSRIG
jgi:hypothetical protein